VHDDAFILSGQIDNPKSIQKVYLLEADTSKMSTSKYFTVDSTNLNEQHLFSFKHRSQHPNLYKLKVGGSMYDIIAQNGDNINFKTDALDTTDAYSLTGSHDVDKLMEFNKMGDHYNKILQKILKEYNYKTQTLGMPRDSFFKIAVAGYTQNKKNYAVMAEKFMMENKESLVGFFAAQSLDPKFDEKALIEYADVIKGKFANNPAVDEFKKVMDDVRPVSIGHKAPDFRLMDQNFKAVKVSDYKGKYLILDFWASWCAPCREENPNVVRLYNKFKDKGLDILGVSLDDNRIDWQNAIRADGLPWRQVSEFKNFNGPTVKMYKIESIPSNFIIDPNGNIIAKNLMGKDLEDFLNKLFNAPEVKVKPM
jgi:peroxiredoxin